MPLQLRMLVDGEACTPVRAPSLRLDPGPSWRIRWEVRCPAGSERSIENGLLSVLSPGHVHFARVRGVAGESVERVLSPGNARWILSDSSKAAPSGSSFVEYVRLGIEHILTGWDHLAFVLALLLLAATVREVALLVTSFTAAHSVTLALATLGVVRPEPVAVEALIGFSIALVAVENVWILARHDRVISRVALGALVVATAFAFLGAGSLAPLTLLGVTLFTGCHFALLQRSTNPARLRMGVAFAFGLIHGFGFAGLLAELELPAGRMVGALVGFNAGVEVGQLGVVLLVWPLLVFAGRRGLGEGRRVVAALGSAAVCGLGTFWFVTRAFG